MRPHGQGLVQRWGRVCFLPPAPYNSAGEFEQATAPPVRLGYAEVLMQEGKLRCPAKGTMAIGKGFQNCALNVGLYTYPELTPQNLPRGVHEICHRVHVLPVISGDLRYVNLVSKLKVKGAAIHGGEFGEGSGP